MQERTVMTRTGGMSSAANQGAGTRTRRILEKSSRNPLGPSMMRVNTMPTALGPSSMAGNIMRPANFGIASPRRRCGAATAKAPNQEIAKVKAKYVLTGWRARKFPLSEWAGIDVDMVRHNITRNLLRFGREARVVRNEGRDSSLRSGPLRGGKVETKSVGLLRSE